MRDRYSENKQMEHLEEGIFLDNTFRIRMALAIVLFVLFLLFDITGKSFGGLTTDEIMEAIAKITLSLA